MKLYHATFARNKDSILSEGLLAINLDADTRRLTGLQKGVYLDPKFEDAYGCWAVMIASWEAENNAVKMVVFEVDIPDNSILVKDPDVSELIIGEGAESPVYIYPHDILPKDVRLVATTEIEF